MANPPIRTGCNQNAPNLGRRVDVEVPGLLCISAHVMSAMEIPIIINAPAGISPSKIFRAANAASTTSRPNCRVTNNVPIRFRSNADNNSMFALFERKTQQGGTEDFW